MSSLKLQGDTSGEITVTVPNVAGTHTLTLPKATGNIATDATVGLGMKNLIINGDMRIAQRGTSFASPSTGNYSLDRWTYQYDVTHGVTITQDTDVPTGQGFDKSLKIAVTTTGTPTGTQSSVLRQKIEGNNLVQLKKGTSSAESVTVSFWVKSNLTGTFIVEVHDTDNSRSISKSYTISSADTWEKKTITYAGDTSGALTYDNSEAIRLSFPISAGPDLQSGTLQTSWGTLVDANRFVGQTNVLSSTSNYINITGVQLEVGENATPFERRMYGTELALCQRYYLEYSTTSIGAYGGIGMASAAGSTSFRIRGISFNNIMRTTPTLVVSGSPRVECGAAYTFTLVNNKCTIHSFGMDGTASSAMNQGDSYSVDLGADGKLTFSAEL